MTDAQPKQMAGTGARRSGRISKKIPILLSGGDTDGRQFSEQTTTLLLSRHGASLISRYKLIPEQEVYLRMLSNNREIDVRVCGEIGERQDGHIYGVAFVDPQVDFWGLEFPPGERLPDSLSQLTLECTGCNARISVQFDAVELDVYTVNDGALRYCKRCLISTIWKRVAADAASAKPKEMADSKQEAEPAPVPAAPVSAPAPVTIPNRRRDRRTKMTCSACIRVPGQSEEVVECLDMSRGGFSFRSSRRYPEELTIEAAIPYAPGGTSIFVSAQIANVREMQKGKLFRYGVAYLRAPK